jgi:hypothetical protein
MPHIQVLAAYMLARGSEFETAPENAWALEVLERDDLDGEEKIEMLLDLAPIRPGEK